MGRAHGGVVMNLVVALLLLGGIGLVSFAGSVPLAQAAGPSSQTLSCPSGTLDEPTFQSYLDQGGTVEYTGTAPCTVTLTKSLTIGGGQTVEIDGGVGLTLDGSDLGGSPAITVTDSSGDESSLALDGVTVKSGNTGISGGNGSIRLVNSTISASSTFAGELNAANTTVGITTSGAVILAGSTISASLTVAKDVNAANTTAGIVTSGAVRLTGSTISANSTVRFNNYAANTTTGIQASGAVNLANSTLSTTGSVSAVDHPNTTTGIETSEAVTLTNSTVSTSSSADVAEAGHNRTTGVTTSGVVRLIGSTIGTSSSIISVPANDTTTGVQASDGSITLAGTIVANTNGANCDTGTVSDLGYNRGTDGTCLQPSTTSKQVSRGQLDLQRLGSYGGPTPTIALGARSVAINQVPLSTSVTINGQSVTLCPSSADGSVTDQRGVARPQGAMCDIGAFEFTFAPTLLTCQVSPAQPDYTNGGQDWYAENVSDTCSLFDDAASPPIYDTVTYHTTVGDGQANPDAALGSPSCQNATGGDCAGVMVTGDLVCSGSDCVSPPGRSFAIDRQKPRVTSPENGRTYTLGQTVQLTCDDGQGSGIAACFGQVIFPDGTSHDLPGNGAQVTLSQLGRYTLQANASDNVNHLTIASASFSAGYGMATLPGNTSTVRRGYYALLRFYPADAQGHDYASRALRVTSVSLVGPAGQHAQTIAFVHRFQFGRFDGKAGYQLTINTRNLARGKWTLNLQLRSRNDATTGQMTFRVE